jgi:hypothetical protein
MKTVKFVWPNLANEPQTSLYPTYFKNFSYKYLIIMWLLNVTILFFICSKMNAHNRTGKKFHVVLWRFSCVTFVSLIVHAINRNPRNGKCTLRETIHADRWKAQLKAAQCETWGEVESRDMRSRNRIPHLMLRTPLFDWKSACKAGTCVGSPSWLGDLHSPDMTTQVGTFP